MEIEKNEENRKEENNLMNIVGSTPIKKEKNKQEEKAWEKEKEQNKNEKKLKII